MTKLTPIESEFETVEDAAAHDAWFRAKVNTALMSDSAVLPHDAVMAEVRAILEARHHAATRLAG